MALGLISGDGSPKRALSRQIEASIRRIAASKKACIVGFSIFPIALRLCLLPWVGIPQPGIQDEFSYLLAGDTFASGRLTNPPHAFWTFFESVHIIQQPTYMAKYPPLTGLVLAFGERVFGHPWAGVLLSAGVLCGVLTWALQGWLPPLWAFLGMIFAVLKIGLLSYWTESYWGGAGAAIGGALLVGALPRLIRGGRFRLGLSAGLGVSLLAISRPFEGFVLMVVSLGYLMLRIRRDSPNWSFAVRRLALRVLAPLLTILVPTAAWMMLYNQRVTGDPFLLPYVLHERQYAVESAFLWQKPRPIPTYRHAAIRKEWVDWDMTHKEFQRQHWVYAHEKSFESVEGFYWGVPWLFLILITFRTLIASRRTGPAIWLGLLFAAGLAAEFEVIPHYAAPGTALAYIAGAGALRVFHHRFQRKHGWRLTVAALLLLSLKLGSDLTKPEHRFLYDKRTFEAERAHVLDFLTQQSGKQLVFVRYGPQHDLNEEWVYNGADIDASRIVWARSMGTEQDSSLIGYFKDRRVWLMDESGTARIGLYGSGRDVTFSGSGNR